MQCLKFTYIQALFSCFFLCFMSPIALPPRLSSNLGGKGRGKRNIYEYHQIHYFLQAYV